MSTKEIILDLTYGKCCKCSGTGELRDSILYYKTKEVRNYECSYCKGSGKYTLPKLELKDVP